MKKNLLTIFGITASFGLFAQLPVSTAPENKNVVLEEFTGITCTFCPQGHAIANTIAANNPGDVVLINVHVGGYATPTGPGTDFRTAFGTAIAGQTNLAGYPAGTVNRHEFAGLQQNTTGTAMSRGQWDQAANMVLAEASYANVALEGSIDYATRVLTVDVEVHFTGVAPGSVNLNVALLQDNVEGPQTGSAGNPSAVLANGNYNHTHMLRHLLTGQWGDVIATTTQGTTYSAQYTYTIPADLNGVDLVMGNFDIAAFIVEGQQEVITGAKGPIAYVNVPNDNATVKTLNIPAMICNPEIEPEVKFRNNGGNDITSATFTYDVAGQNSTTYNWTGSIASFSEATITLPSITVPASGGAVNVEITNVNGNTDSDPTDNLISTNVTFTTFEGTGEVYTFDFNQDRYGSESTWEIVLEATGAVLASGGPYADLAANGVLLHSSQVTLPSVDCYAVKVYDSYGDGINSGYGAGNYKLYNSLNQNVLLSNGVFEAEDVKPFKVTSLTENGLGFEDVTEALSISVYPNPVNDVANIEFNLNNSNGATISLHNSIGELVYTNATLSNGLNKVTIGTETLANGFYIVSLTTENGTLTKKISINK